MAHITMDIELPQSFVGDILVTAFDGVYGGCLHWASHKTRPGGESSVKVGGLVENADWVGVNILFDYEASPRAAMRVAYRAGWDVTAATIAVGLHTWMRQANSEEEADRRKTAVRELDAGMIDAADADAIIQYGLFADVVFG